MDNEFSSGCDTLDSMSQHGSSGPRSYSLKYLKEITKGFSEKIGEGGFGTVYKGWLPNGGMVAVKKVISSMLPGVTDKQFENEANHLKMLNHPNIVLLVGWCSETEHIYVEYNRKHICAEKLERLLCLEYMSNGDLRQHLKDESSRLTWEARYKIIKGICYGLHYLHEESQLGPIVHMDLKPANILLDNNMVPKIADFGLSRLFSEEKTKTTTLNCNGTLGYMSPEYIHKGIISKKADIFSLGVIIIEIVAGHRDYPDGNGGISSAQFTELVLKNWRNRLQKSLEIDYQQIRRCIQIGLDCVKSDRSERPTISQVIKMLQETESADFLATSVTKSAVQSHRKRSRDFDLNSGPGLDDVGTEPVPKNLPTKNASSIQFLQDPGLRMNNVSMSNISPWLTSANPCGPVGIQSFLPSRGKQLYQTEAASGAQRIIASTPDNGQFGGDPCRAPVISTPPAMVFHPPAHQYAGFPSFPPSVHLQAPAFSVGAATFVNSSAVQYFPSLSPPLVGCRPLILGSTVHHDHSLD